MEPQELWCILTFKAGVCSGQSWPDSDSKSGQKLTEISSQTPSTGTSTC